MKIKLRSLGFKSIPAELLRATGEGSGAEFEQVGSGTEIKEMWLQDRYGTIDSGDRIGIRHDAWVPFSALPQNEDGDIGNVFSVGNVIIARDITFVITEIERKVDTLFEDHWKLTLQKPAA